MRRPPITAFLTAGACALSLAAPAAAQTSASQAVTPKAAPSSASAAGLRYLNWPGRTYRPAVVASATPLSPAATAPVATPVLTPARVPNTPTRPPIIPHGGQAEPTYAPAPNQELPQRQGLTPASAWISPQAPAYQSRPATPVEDQGPRPYLAEQPYPAAAPPAAPSGAPWNRAPAVAPTPAASAPVSSPAPSGYFAETAEAAPPPLPVPPPVAAPMPRSAPAPLPAPAPAPLLAAAPPVMESAPADAPGVDPMAPRRDAPIFRLQRPSPQPAPAQGGQTQSQTEAQPAPGAETPAYAPAAQGGARYYSVHRQAGRQPDATPLPPPVYLDALPVDLTAMPASTDLAEPPAAPNLIRNANGRIQALPANEDPVLP